MSPTTFSVILSRWRILEWGVMTAVAMLRLRLNPPRLRQFVSRTPEIETAHDPWIRD
jgi:hypothetical protein